MQERSEDIAQCPLAQRHLSYGLVKDRLYIYKRTVEVDHGIVILLRDLVEVSQKLKGFDQGQ